MNINNVINQMQTLRDRETDTLMSLILETWIHTLESQDLRETGSLRAEIADLRQQITERDDRIGSLIADERKLRVEISGLENGYINVYLHPRCDRKIMAIKNLRNWTGCGLADAKYMYEDMEEDPNMYVNVPRVMDISNPAYEGIFIFREDQA